MIRNSFKKNRPLLFFVIIIVGIFAIDVSILFLTGRLKGNVSDVEKEFLDSAATAVILSPLIYFLFIRSFTREIKEREAAEEKLNFREKELVEAQHLGMIGSWSWDIPSDTIEWSDEYYRIFGLDLSKKPPKYEEHLKIYTPESAARLDAAVKLNVKTGKPYELDLEIAHPKGNAQWITARSETVRGEKGKIIGLRGTAQDITERKLAAIEREQFMKFFQISTDIMVIADPLGCFKKVNPATLHLLGYSEKVLISKPFIDFVHPDDKQPTIDEMARQMKIGSSLDFKNRYVRKDGGVLLLSWRANYDKNDGITYATARDITKEAKAQEENERLAAIVRNITDAVISIGVDFKVISWNRGAEQMYEYSESEVIGKDVRYFIVPESRFKESGMLVDKIKKGEEIKEFETQRKRKSGEIFDASITASPIRDEKGGINAISIIFHDITKAKEIERAKNDFLVLASHQLRTPLSGTRWMIETLKRGIFGKLEGKQKEYLDEIYRTNNRMIELVSGMMDVLKLESGEIFREKEKISNSKLSEDIISMAGPLAESKKISLKDSLKGRGDVEAVSDFQGVKNILETFVSNAVNYSPAGGKVEFGIKEEEGNVVFFVKDNGIGIPEEEKKHIFERFFRGYKAKTIKPGGTGLGLSLASLIADKIGGKISFDSKEGKGSTFYLRLGKNV